MKTFYTTRQLSLALTFILGLLPTLGFSQTYATIPYSTGFESGALDGSWTATSSQAGTNIEVIQTGTLTWSTQTAVSHSGTYFLGMDYEAGGIYNMNQADLHLNTTGESGLRLQFWWAEWNDETEPEDGIYISDNGGLSYFKVLDLNGTSYTDLTWTHFNLSLDSINSIHGLTFSSNYIIRFQQYDNYYFAGGNDGFLFDDIEVSTTCIPTSSNISPAICESYTVPSGDETYTMSGNYVDTLVSTSGCDSIINIALTIYPTSSSSVIETACDSYTSDGGVEYAASGLYTETYQNVNMCDSIVSLDITINSSSSSTITESALDQYTAPSGAIYTSSGMYMDTIANAVGCDSVITINLSVSHTGIEEYTKAMLQIFPNPTKGSVRIDGLQNLNAISSIQLVDINGREVSIQLSNTNEFSIEKVEAGMYYLVIQHEAGLSRIQIIKE